MRSLLVQYMFHRQKGFYKKLEEFEKTQYYSETELRNYQEEKLQRLIKYAYEFVPYYKELFDSNRIKPDDIKIIEDLQKIPILDKETLRSNFSKMLSSNSRKYNTRTTGGSTGVPLRIAVENEAGIVEMALRFRFLRSLGYKWGDEILQFWGEHPLENILSKLKNKLSKKIYNITFFNTYYLNDKIYEKILYKLRNSPPKVLRGYTSSIYYLALHALQRGLKIQLNAVSTTAEKLFKYQRNKIQEAFGENIFDQYGCGETNSIAFECEKHKGLHVASEHVILEIVNNRGEKSDRGNVIITNLDNYAMPIIRYENGDLARWSSIKCDCQRNLPLLEEIEGRVYDFIEGPNGNKVHAGFIDEIFLNLNLGSRYNIKEFRIVQERLDKLRIEFVTENDIKQKDKKIIKEKINHYLGNVEIEIKKVKSIPLTKMGKKIFVLSLLNRDKWE